MSRGHSGLGGGGDSRPSRGWYGRPGVRSPAEWNIENVGLVVIGVLVTVSALAMAIRPSRFTVGSMTLAVIAGGPLGALA